MIPAAFFDLDGTLLPPPTLERRFLRYLVWRQELSFAQWARWCARFLREVWRDPEAGMGGNKTLYAGVRVSALDAFAAFLRRYPVQLRPAALAQLGWHAVQGHSIVFVSGTLFPLADVVATNVAALLGKTSNPLPIRVVATRLESSGGRLTGQIAGAFVSGMEKARAIERLSESAGFDLRRSHAYGDRYADRWMLERVRFPAAVNPSPRLRRLAMRHGWPVLLWEVRGPAGPGHKFSLRESPTTVTQCD